MCLIIFKLLLTLFNILLLDLSHRMRSLRAQLLRPGAEEAVGGVGVADLDQAQMMVCHKVNAIKVGAS